MIMAKITVAVYTTLREKLGFSRKDFEGKNLAEIIDAVCRLKREAPGLLLDGLSKVKSHFVVTLNSEIVDNSKLKKTKIKDGDILHIFPPVSGG